MAECTEFSTRVKTQISFEAFVAVLAQWTLNPENSWRGVIRAVLDDEATTKPQVQAFTSVHALDGRKWSEEDNFSVTRTLYPRYEEKDVPIKEEVLFDFVKKSMTRRPVVDSPAVIRKLSRFYPKVFEFEVSYSAADEATSATSPDLNEESKSCHDHAEAESAQPLPIAAELRIRARMLPEQDETKMKQMCASVLKTLNKWGKNQMKPGGYKKRGKYDQLVPYDEYAREYKRMKLKYRYWADEEKWPEKTDPKKFVFEDIAIASYLLCLWRAERIAEAKEASDTPAAPVLTPDIDKTREQPKDEALSQSAQATAQHSVHPKNPSCASTAHIPPVSSDKKQIFVDLGCGNGFLVYLLSSEGHKGYGIDLQKRRIWDLYDCAVDLRQVSVDPSDLSFPDADWILANHADELSVWTPIVAFRSSYRTKFWNLPCCFYGFSGSRFQRRDTRVTQYQGFQNYLRHVTELCGFVFEEDMMRIPSTKDMAQFGRVRTYSENDAEAVKRIEAAIEKELRVSSFEGFTARENPCKRAL